MSTLVRALLWVIAILAPGGFLLLPVLAREHMQNRRRRAEALVPVAVGGLGRAL